MSMLSLQVLVPIHLDALYVNEGRSVIGPNADFSRLPYFDGQGIANPSVANISEEIARQSFQALNFYLEPGVHLPWALPDALAKASRWTQTDLSNRDPVFSAST